MDPKEKVEVIAALCRALFYFGALVAIVLLLVLELRQVF